MRAARVHAVDGPKSGNLTDEGRALGCNLGALGVITEVTFQAVDLFNLEAKDDTRNYWLETTMLSRDGLRSLLQEAPYVSALWWPDDRALLGQEVDSRPTAQPTTFEVQYFLNQLGIWLGAGVVTEVGKVLGDHPEWTPIFTAMVFDEIRHQEYVSPAPDVFHFITKYPMVWNMSYAFDVEGYSDAGVDRAVKAWTSAGGQARRIPQPWAVPAEHGGAHAAHQVQQLAAEPLHRARRQRRAGNRDLARTEEGGLDQILRRRRSAWLELPGRPHWGKTARLGRRRRRTAQPEPAPGRFSAVPVEQSSTAFRNVRQAWDPARLFQESLHDGAAI